MKHKIWNGKAKGILSATILILVIIWEKVTNKITTFLFVNNIKKCGKEVRVMKGCKYRYPNSIEVGNKVIIGEQTSLVSEDLETRYLLLEEGVSIGKKCQIDFSGGIIIRQYAHIAHQVLISTHDHGYDYQNIPIGKNLEIKENAFIGSNSIILHNVRSIGKNAVVGTGSVVTKEVPDYAVVVGNPAKIIKYIKNGEKS